jgi:hypothetical protein
MPAASRRPDPSIIRLARDDDVLPASIIAAIINAFIGAATLLLILRLVKRAA